MSSAGGTRPALPWALRSSWSAPSPTFALMFPGETSLLLSSCPRAPCSHVPACPQHLPFPSERREAHFCRGCMEVLQFECFGLWGMFSPGRGVLRLGFSKMEASPCSTFCFKLGAG